jgi:hypothetical protein
MLASLRYFGLGIPEAYTRKSQFDLKEVVQVLVTPS